jgi:hypothetical protein
MGKTVNTGSNLAFDLSLQDGLVGAHGANMIHEIGIRCTCAISDTFAGMKDDGKQNRRNPFCPQCLGSGWLYRDPKTVKGIATSIRQQRNIIDAGYAVPGDMVFSPSIKGFECGARRIGTWDQLTATWEQPLDDGQVIVRGAATTGDNTGIKTDLSDNQDRLWYDPSSAIWCEDEDGVVYHEKTDFILGPGKVITWQGNKPNNNVRYNIKYNCFFEWISFQPPMPRLDKDNQSLGDVVFLRKKHVAFINEAAVETNNIEKMDLQYRIKC